MASSNGQPRHPAHPAAEWIQPPDEEEGLTRYVETLRERRWVVATCVVISTAVAIAYVLLAPKSYEAEADLLITPASSSDSALAGLPVFRQSSDPARDVQTASRLVENIDVARRVSELLPTSPDPQELLNTVSAEPVANSNIVAVRASAESPEAARDVADAFATEAIAEQTAALHGAIDSLLPGIRAEVRRQGAGSAAGDPLAAQLVALETLRSGTDPTMNVQALADPPRSAASPKAILSIAAGIVGGALLGVVAAFTLQTLDPRLRREEQLRRLYRLPILARIPRDGGSVADRPLSPARVSPATSEAYRTLRGLLAARARGGGSESRAILVTGSSHQEGKTTTAVNLAASLASVGNRVILIEADLRRPTVSRTFGVSADRGVVSVLIERLALEESLVSTPLFGSTLRLLLADHQGGWISELFVLPAARDLIEDARELADFVIIDSPPLTDFVDALPLASYVDDVLLVARVGSTDLRKLAHLGELLAENGIRPAGFTVVGTPRPRPDAYHYYSERGDRKAGEKMPRQLVRADGRG